MSKEETKPVDTEEEIIPDADGEESAGSPAVDEEEYAAAVKAARKSASEFDIEFKPPFVFEEETFTSLHFDFGSLTGADCLAIERELMAMGRALVAPEFSGDFMLRMVMRSCTTKRKDGRKLGIDAFSAMPIATFIRLRNKARSFLMNAGS